MKIRTAFTMIELVFVIVVMGILAKFGVEFLARAYESFIFSSTNNSLQSKSAAAVEFIANRLQYRIKDSVIVRVTKDANLTPLADAAAGVEYLVLEWIAVDIDGFRGVDTPLWSGIIDLDAGTADTLVSPATQTQNIDILINRLSNANSGINDSALYFIGSNSDINGFGWDGALTNQNGVMHPVRNVVANTAQFASSNGVNFSGVDIYEYYQLAWTANAIIIERDTLANKNRLIFYYDYQPWNGDTFNDAKSSTLMEDISTFQAISIGSMIKIQVCAKSDLVEEYSLCKEKTIY